MKSRCSEIMNLADDTYKQYETYGNAVADAVLRNLEMQKDFISVDILLTNEEKNDMRVYITSYIVSFYLSKFI